MLLAGVVEVLALDSEKCAARTPRAARFRVSRGVGFRNYSTADCKWLTSNYLMNYLPVHSHHSESKKEPLPGSSLPLAEGFPVHSREFLVTVRLILLGKRAALELLLDSLVPRILGSCA